MAGYQYTIIIGNVGRDPELRYTPAGVAVCDFTVAVSRRWNDRTTNEQREKTTWFRVSAWRGLAETANQFVHKGMQIMVAGEIDASAFTGQDGQPRASLDLTARDIQFLGRRGETAAEPGEYPSEPEDLPF
ncbi:MAG TPA: single-stranded DNA-binding protein [Aggregatilineaceae bacterium]|jgi:single-strand DNA-binding protein|nr:single-stranded DNA-binding protein [Aggregatilineaceae bacterium]